MRGLLCFVVTFGMMLPLVAGAAPTVSSSPCPIDSDFSCITAINDLTVFSDQYDVRIVGGTFNSLFSDPANQLASWGNLTFANAANVAIFSALNALTPSPNDTTTKFYDYGANFRYETVLHLPTEYKIYGDDPFGAFNGQCEVVDMLGMGIGSCGTWLTNDILASRYSPRRLAFPNPVPSACSSLASSA